MRFRGIEWTAVLRLCLLSCALVSEVGAVIFDRTGDPDFNTEPPTGAQADSGWQWMGTWRAYTGVPVAARFFLAAGHVGAAIGDPFMYRGVSYTVTEVHDDPESDLVLLGVDRDFPDFAPLHRAGVELGQPVMVYGRGATRGDPVWHTNVVGQVALKGWLWGEVDGRLRWGQNVVDGSVPGGPGVGNLLAMSFSAGAGATEAHLAVNDSSGAVFVHYDGHWQLAGVVFAVTGPFAYDSSGPTFNAALTDMGGLFVGSAPRHFVPDELAPVPSSFYATRIVDRLPWLDAVLGIPGTVPALPGWAVSGLAGALAWLGVHRLGSGARRRGQERWRDRGMAGEAPPKLMRRGRGTR